MNEEELESVSATDTCLFCGQLEQVQLLEIYEDGVFTLDCCCQGMHESVSDYLADNPKDAAKWMNGAFPEFRALRKRGLRRVVDDGSQLLLDWNLEVVPVEWAEAKAFVAVHHRHCAAPAGWRFGAGVRNGFQLLGVVTVGRPVARAFDHRRVVEVNRCCIRTDVPQDLRSNGCSLLYGWAAREARRRGFERIQTYTLASEPGIALRAAGWRVDGRVEGRARGWRSGVPTVDKIRWALDLRPSTGV